METTPQIPIGSGFNKDSTAREVIAGINLSGKLALVTGGYSGLGLETVRALAGAGAKVLVAARRPDVAAEALKDIAGTEVAALDLGDLSSVKAFADGFLASGRPLEILINNAAVMANPETRVGQGWESQFATNHLGHFAMTSRIAPALLKAQGARVVSLSSIGHKRSPIRFQDIHFRSEPYEKWTAYGQAKTANALFAMGLDRRLRTRGVRAFSVHPGGIMTPLQRHLQMEEMIAFGWVDAEGKVNARFKSTEQGAATSVWCATSPRLVGMGGVYCEDCDISQAVEAGANRFAGVDPHARDADAAEKLWAISVEATGVDLP